MEIVRCTAEEGRDGASNFDPTGEEDKVRVFGTAAAEKFFSLRKIWRMKNAAH